MQDLHIRISNCQVGEDWDRNLILLSDKEHPCNMSSGKRKLPLDRFPHAFFLSTAKPIGSVYQDGLENIRLAI